MTVCRRSLVLYYLSWKKLYKTSCVRNIECTIRKKKNVNRNLLTYDYLFFGSLEFSFHLIAFKLKKHNKYINKRISFTVPVLPSACGKCLRGN